MQGAQPFFVVVLEIYNRFYARPQFIIYGEGRPWMNQTDEMLLLGATIVSVHMTKAEAETTRAALTDQLNRFLEALMIPSGKNKRSGRSIAHVSPGDVIKMVQRSLNRLAKKGALKVTGKMGQATINAIERYGRRLSLLDHRVLRPEKIRRLFSGHAWAYVVRHAFDDPSEPVQ